MTKHSPKTRGHFNSLKSQTINALFAIYDLEIKARDKGDAKSASDLFDARETLRKRLLDIRRAEIAFLLSEASTTTAEGRLGEITADLKRNVHKLRRVRDALETATEIAGLLGRLVDLVR